MPHQQNQATCISQPFDGLSDEALIQALAHGAVWAMEPLYRRYHRILYALAYRIVADQQVAENLLQEVFLAVWQHAASYTPQAAAVRPWLIAIMHHCAIDYLRHMRCRSILKEVTWEEVKQDERIASPDVWEQLLRGAEVREALLKLPKEQKLVIELAYFQGWTHEEIAKQYQLPLGTVKGRIRLGLVRLRRELEQGEGHKRT
jgi:RNA polymerase sigma-70 factor (ECF subfamily)